MATEHDGICCHCGEFLFLDKGAILYINKEEYCPWNTADCEYDEGCQCFKCEAIKEKATAYLEGTKKILDGRPGANTPRGYGGH